MIWFRFVVASLAVWRLTHLIVEEDGPWDIVVRVRQRLGESFFGQLMDCFYCTSVWVSVPFAFWVTGDALDRLVVWLGLSGAASLFKAFGRSEDQGG
jgi:hypothetical protein